MGIHTIDANKGQASGAIPLFLFFGYLQSAL